MALRLGIDVGGTFTDLFLHDDASGEFWLAKTPSTPEDQSIGVLGSAYWRERARYANGLRSIRLGSR